MLARKPTEATPVLSVLITTLPLFTPGVPPVRLPGGTLPVLRPPPTVNVTGTFETGFPDKSVTFTDRGLVAMKFEATIWP